MPVNARSFGQERRASAALASQIFDAALGSHLRAAAFLIVCALALFAPGLTGIAPVDREEAMLAQSTKQMLESGNYVDLQYQDEFRYKRPVAINWMQAATLRAAAAVGVDRPEFRIWLYRLPTLIGAIGAVLATYWAALAFVSRRAALLAALMLASSMLMMIEARLATADSAFLAFCVIAMGQMARAYLAGPSDLGWRGANFAGALAFWAATGIAVLLKGPQIFLFQIGTLLSLVVLDRDLRWFARLRPLVGLVLLALIVAPWIGAVLLYSGEPFGDGWQNADWITRLIGVWNLQGLPPGTYLVLYWVLFWPGAVLTGLAMPAVWQARREPAARFLLSFVVPAWIVLELVLTKFPHFLLPLLPPIAILIAGTVDARLLSRAGWLRAAPPFWFIIPLGVVLFVIGGLLFVMQRFGVFSWPFAAGAAVFGLMAWRLFDIDRPEEAIGHSFISALLLGIAVFGVLVPTLRNTVPGVAAARAFQRAECDGARFVTAGYGEPSLIFLMGNDVAQVDGAGAANFLLEGGCRYALVEERVERAFARQAEATGLRYSLKTRLNGFSIVSGERISLAVFRSDMTP